MSKIKILAKYTLLGDGARLLLSFIIFFSAVILCGDFAYIIRSFFEIRGLFLPSGVKLLLSLAGACIFAVVIPPLRLGREKWFLDKAKGENPAFSVFFIFFDPHSIVKAMKIWWYAAIMKGFSLALFLFPSICLSGILAFSFKEGETSRYILLSLLCADIILTVTGLCFYFVYTADWFMYYGYAVSNKNISPSRALEKSRELCCAKRKRICLFKLSFLPWLLSCIFIVPVFYVWGYYKEACAMLTYRNEYLYL